MLPYPTHDVNFFTRKKTIVPAAGFLIFGGFAEVSHHIPQPVQYNGPCGLYGRLSVTILRKSGEKCVKDKKRDHVLRDSLCAKSGKQGIRSGSRDAEISPHVAEYHGILDFGVQGVFHDSSADKELIFLLRTDMRHRTE